MVQEIMKVKKKETALKYWQLGFVLRSFAVGYMGKTFSRKVIANAIALIVTIKMRYHPINF